MRPPPLTALKLGGALLTEGDLRPRVRRDLLLRVAREVARGRRGALLLVHGAGSFGHGPVGRGEPPWKIHLSVQTLSGEVSGALARAGLPVVPIDPFSAGGLPGLVRPVRAVLGAGFTPLLPGSIVPRGPPGRFDVLSGDLILSHLARVFGARRVGMATNVEGVLKEGRPLPFLGARERVEFFPVAGDVTGAMQGKVRELRRLARRGVFACVFSGERPGNVRRFLEGKAVGTRVR